MTANDAADFQSRRDFLKVGAATGGGLLLGVVLPLRLTGTGREQVRSSGAGGPAFAVDAFIRIDATGLVTFVMPKVEMGQGTYTSLPMLIAEELEVDLSQVRLEHAGADDARYRDPLLGEQITGGSLAVRAFWEPLRRAGAVARTMLVGAAAQAWRVDPVTCRADKGLVTHTPSGRTLSYGELAARAAALPVPSQVALKDPKDFKLIGTPIKRLDAAEKVNGRARFGIDVRLPGMRVATVAACPVVGGKLLHLDDAKARAMKGVREVVRIDDTVAVVADNMWAAKQGLAALEIRWSEGEHASFSNEVLLKQMEAASAKEGIVAQHLGDAAGVLAGAQNKVGGVYQLPFLAHAAMEPINCTVELTGKGCDIWVGTQVPARTQATAAEVTGLPREQVRVHNHYLGGGFGRRLEHDFVTQAVSLAKRMTQPGPVKFVWTREEDIRHDIVRPYFYHRVSAALDASGMPIAWTHRVTGSSVMARWFPGFVKDGLDLDAVDGAIDLPYAIPNVHVDYVRHEPPMPTGNWRGVGASHNVFVVESFLDELAARANRDPVAYRRALLGRSPRAKAVLDLAAEKAGWGTPLPSRAGAAGVRTGRGVSLSLGFASFASQVAEVAVSPDGVLSVTRVVCALDCGRIVNPDTVRAQIEGGIMFGLSAALREEITFKGGRIEQSNFHDYRVLRMNEAPVVEVYLIASTENPGGIGEVGTAALFPAVTNAVFAATGKRVRKLPLSTESLATT